MSGNGINVFRLTAELVKLPQETSWLEFKHNNCDPIMIGTDICALANAAALAERDRAYMIWGVNNETHEIVGVECPPPISKGRQRGTGELVETSAFE